MLSLKLYGWRCVLGAEVTYVVCLVGGYLPLRSARDIELHHTFFETLPGFVWGNVGSYLLGAVYLFIFASILAWYYVWMHNASSISQER